MVLTYRLFIYKHKELGIAYTNTDEGRYKVTNLKQAFPALNLLLTFWKMLILSFTFWKLPLCSYPNVCLAF
jgi:hypothetical protein